MLAKFDKADFFQCLPEREKNVSDKSFEVFHGEFGNFNVVVIQTKGGLFAGVAKRNPSDKPSEAGECIAAVRAWRDYQGKDGGYSRQRPVTKAEAKRISLEAHLDKVLDDLRINLV